MKVNWVISGHVILSLRYVYFGKTKVNFWCRDKYVCDVKIAFGKQTFGH